LNQRGKDERIDQDLGLNQDGKDERIDQDLGLELGLIGIYWIRG